MSKKVRFRTIMEVEKLNIKMKFLSSFFLNFEDYSEFQQFP